jgi:hypothetical protein
MVIDKKERCSIINHPFFFIFFYLEFERIFEDEILTEFVEIL